MKFRWAAGALVSAAALAAGLALWPRQESSPLTDHVPENALLYAEFGSLAEAEALAAVLPPEWSDPILSRLAESREHLTGKVAIYLDGEAEWVALARVKGDVSVIAQSPDALERHRSRKGSLSQNPRFQGTPIHIDFEALRLPGRLGDFSTAGLEVVPGPPLTLRGRLSYRRDRFRICLEHYVHAPPPAAPSGTAPVRASFPEYLPRIWEEILDALAPEDLERVEHEARAVSRDLLEGKSLPQFLARLGPSCGFTADGALLGWIELPDAETREILEAILERVARDVSARTNPPLFTVTREGDVRRVSLRDGGGFSYTIEGNLFLFTNGTSFPELPPRAPSTDHVTLELETTPAFEALRALRPVPQERLSEWEGRLGWIKSLSLRGRFTGEGLEVELRARRRK
jgi:hypothetical protein